MSTTNDSGKQYKYLGQTLGNIHITSVIAEGGMGVIYLGHQALTQRKVAVKILRPERQDSERDREYFQREAHALSKIRHPNLMELYSVGTTPDGEYFMVLEYVPGRTLRKVAEEEGAISPLRCATLFRQLLLALQATHAHDIIHRDLKPDNLLIEDLGNSKERLLLADLGLVKFIRGQMKPLTEVGMTVGTPCYMSPEQVRGRSLDARSDLYSMGVLMFETLTSYLPYPKAQNVDALLDHILDTKPAKLVRANPKFKAYPQLQLILDRLMEKNPDDRYNSTAEVLIDLDRALKTELSNNDTANFLQPPSPMLSTGELRVDPRLANTAQAIVLPPEVRGESVRDGILVTFLTDNLNGRKVSPAPDLLKRLRAWLEQGGEIAAAERKGNSATFGIKPADGIEKVLAGIPYLIHRIQDEFSNITIRAGVALGSFDIDPQGRPAQGKATRQALRFAVRAQPGQVLIDRKTAARYRLDSPT